MISKKIFIKNIIDVHLKEVISGASIALFLMIIGAALSFILNVILARTLGSKEAGIFFLSLTCVTVAASIGRFGLDNTIIRYISEQASKKNWSLVACIYRKALTIILIGSIAVSIVFYLNIEFLCKYIFRNSNFILPFKISTLSIIPLAILTANSQALQGIKYIKISTLVLNVLVPLFTVISILLLAPKYSVNGAVYGYVISCILVMLYSLWAWKTKNRSNDNVKENFPWINIFRSSLPLFFITILTLIITWSPEIMLGIWSNSSDVAIYSVANRTAKLTTFILLAVNKISAPMFSELFAKNDLINLKKTAQNTTKIILIITAPVFIPLIFIPSFFMGLFGPEFRDSGSYVLALLSIGQLVNISTGSVGVLLMMTGHENALRNNVIIIGILSLTLNYLFISNYGLIGAAISTMITLSTMNILSLLMVRFHLKFWVIPYL